MKDSAGQYGANLKWHCSEKSCLLWGRKVFLSNTFCKNLQLVTVKLERSRDWSNVGPNFCALRAATPWAAKEAAERPLLSWGQFVTLRHDQCECDDSLPKKKKEKMEEEENVFREDSFLIGHAMPCVFVFSLFWLVVLQEQNQGRYLSKSEKTDRRCWSFAMQRSTDGHPGHTFASSRSEFRCEAWRWIRCLLSQQSLPPSHALFEGRPQKDVEGYRFRFSARSFHHWGDDGAHAKQSTCSGLNARKFLARNEHRRPNEF